MAFATDTHHRINQALAKAGSRVVLDWNEIDQLADEIEKVDRIRVGPFDDDPCAQILARHYVELYRSLAGVGSSWPDKAASHDDVEHRHTEIYPHDGPQYDTRNPHTFNRLYAILPGLDIRFIIPLSDDYTFEDVANAYLSLEQYCHINAALGCSGSVPNHQRSTASMNVAIKYGEFVCIFRSCKKCFDWLSEPEASRRWPQKCQETPHNFGELWPLSDDDLWRLECAKCNPAESLSSEDDDPWWS